MYIQSTNIDIFPMAKSRDGISLTNRLFYEQNIANLIRQVVDKEGFIISGGELNGTELSTDLIFNIYGYWVCIKSGTDLKGAFDSGNEVSAHITLNNDPVQEIVGQDEGEGTNKLYEGLLLSSSAPSVDAPDNQCVKSLLLFIKDSNGWKVNSDAFYKVNCSSVDFRGFNPQLLNISSIDGKPQLTN